MFVAFTLRKPFFVLQCIERDSLICLDMQAPPRANKSKVKNNGTESSPVIKASKHSHNPTQTPHNSYGRFPKLLLEHYLHNFPGQRPSNSKNKKQRTILSSLLAAEMHHCHKEF